MIKDNLPQEKWESIFPIRLGHLACNNMITSSMIESNLLNFNLRFCQGMRDFDRKYFVAKVLSLKGQSPIVPHLEDLWEDCNDEKEVVKKEPFKINTSSN